MSKKKKIFNCIIVMVAIFVCGLMIGDCIGTKRIENSVEQAQKNANDKVEEIRKKLLPDQYLTQVNLYSEIISDLKEYREYILENNEDTSQIDKIIRNYIQAGKDLDGYEEIIPSIDTAQLRERGDEYFEEYLNEMEQLIDTYPNGYKLNSNVKFRLEKLEENYYDLIDSSELFKKMHLLEEKCETNMKLWEY